MAPSLIGQPLQLPQRSVAQLTLSLNTLKIYIYFCHFEFSASCHVEPMNCGRRYVEHNTSSHHHLISDNLEVTKHVNWSNLVACVSKWPHSLRERAQFRASFHALRRLAWPGLALLCFASVRFSWVRVSVGKKSKRPPPDCCPNYYII